MRKTIKLALAASMVLGATSAFATNGTALIGYGAKSRAMGGTGVAQFQGAESGFNNPALIGYAKGTEVSIGGTYFAPDVSVDIAGFGPADGTYDSTASASMIPAVSMATKVNDSFAWGLALYGVGGMGVDYRDDNQGAVTGGAPGDGLGGSGLPTTNDNLLLMRFSVPLTYTIADFAVGVSPVIEYGALSMNGMFGDAGVTTDIAYGFEIGAAYQIAGVTLGLDYKSAVTHDFKNTFQSSATNSKLDTPAVIAAGVSYNFLKNHTVAFDYKNIGYGSAKGFEDFLWEDQDVFALGYEFAADSWAVRVGYNHGSQPLPTEVAADFSNANQIVGSLLAFPAVTEDHYTVGGTYAFSETISVDGAFVYGTGSAKTEGDFNPLAPGVQSIEATNDQISLTAALNYNF